MILVCIILSCVSIRYYVNCMSVNEFNKNNRKTAKYNIVEHQQCRANYMNALDRDAETNASSMQDHTSASLVIVYDS